MEKLEVVITVLGTEGALAGLFAGGLEGFSALLA
jgi:hypothetical protein